MLYSSDDHQPQVVGEPSIAPKAGLIGADALVTQKRLVPDGSVVPGSTGRIVRTLALEGQQALRQSSSGIY